MMVRYLKSFLFILYVSFALIFSHCANIPIQKEETTTFLGYTVHKVVFPNQLKLITLQDTSSPTFSYHTWFHVGSKNEVPGKTGLAHLFEHMMFKATKHLKDGAFDHTLESHGAVGLNAATWKDYTYYHESMAKNHLDLVSSLEAERFQNLIINPHAFKTEREVVQNERRYRNENSPDGKMYETLFKLTFKKHSYHWPVIGYEKDLNQMTAQDARAFHKRFYDPARATIVVVGDLDPQKVKATIWKHYHTLKHHHFAPQVFAQEAAQKHAKRKTLKLNISNEKLMIAYRIPGVRDPNTAAFEMLQSILTDGSASRLQKALVHTEIATSVSSGNWWLEDPSIFVIEVQLQKGRSAALAEVIIQKELLKLTKKAPSISEWKRAQNMVRYQFFSNLEGFSQKASFIGEKETLFGDFMNAYRIFTQKIPALTPDKLPQMIQKYFQPYQKIVITGVPS